MSNKRKCVLVPGTPGLAVALERWITSHNDVVHCVHSGFQSGKGAPVNTVLTADDVLSTYQAQAERGKFGMGRLECKALRRLRGKLRDAVRKAQARAQIEEWGPPL